MKNIIFKNLIIFIISLFFIIIFLEVLNLVLSGVPIYDKLGINRFQLTYIKSKNTKINNNFFPRNENSIINKSYIENCGYQESGIYHQTFTPDLNGFWNNDNKLYKNTDIVMIGDSFGMSSCVNSPYDFRSQLEKKSKKKILNLSPGSGGPLKQLRVIEEFTKDTNFEYFIWFYYEGNDEIDLSREIAKNFFGKEMSFSRKVTDKNIHPFSTQYRILASKDEIFVDYKKLLKWIDQFQNIKKIDKDYAKKWDSEILVRSKIFLAERLRGLNSLIKYFNNEKRSTDILEKEYEAVVKRMNIYLNSKEITKKYICYLPKYTRLVHKKKNHPEVRRLNELKDTIKVIGEKYGFEFIDAAKFFHNRKNPLDIFPYQLPNHYNENGYKILAEYVNKSIF